MGCVTGLHIINNGAEPGIRGQVERSRWAQFSCSFLQFPASYPIVKRKGTPEVLVRNSLHFAGLHPNVVMAFMAFKDGKISTVDGNVVKNHRFQHLTCALLS